MVSTRYSKEWCGNRPDWQKAQALAQFSPSYAAHSSEKCQQQDQ
jgi:hypothetical protein